MVFYLSYRKFVAPFGFICSCSVIAFTYKYLTTHTIIYAFLDVAATGLSVFILYPLFCNQVVEIVDNRIIVHNFRKKTPLTIHDWEMTRRDKHGNNSYHFLKDGKCYVVTPDLYINNEIMLEEFERIFNTHDVKVSKKASNNVRAMSSFRK